MVALLSPKNTYLPTIVFLDSNTEPSLVKVYFPRIFINCANIPLY